METTNVASNMKSKRVRASRLSALNIGCHRSTFYRRSKKLADSILSANNMFPLKCESTQPSTSTRGLHNTNTENTVELIPANQRIVYEPPLETGINKSPIMDPEEPTTMQQLYNQYNNGDGVDNQRDSC
ncbi:hypothetical protein MN116_000505 [Schistosoma mekongi]|uniref:Uncharacterized protein n=1 Tax=Schistosoma mekongi TaxID=38744 RepID=A0AAE1ZDU7_SCHME|nr:hypothetical protein MN116_000505 [Schistosoma mekongi]